MGSGTHPLEVAQKETFVEAAHEQLHVLFKSLRHLEQADAHAPEVFDEWSRIKGAFDGLAQASSTASLTNLEAIFNKAAELSERCQRVAIVTDGEVFVLLQTIQDLTEDWIDALTLDEPLEIDENLISHIESMIQVVESPRQPLAEASLDSDVWEIHSAEHSLTAPTLNIKSIELPAIDAELMQSYISEVDEILDDMRKLPAQASDYSPEDWQAWKRYLHTIKGSSRLVQIEPLGQYCHELEDCLTDILQANDSVKNQRIHHLFEGITNIEYALVHLSKQSEVAEIGAPVDGDETVFAQVLQSPYVKIKQARLDSLRKMASEANRSRAHLSQQVFESKRTYQLMLERVRELRESVRQFEWHLDHNQNHHNQAAFLNHLKKSHDDFDALEFDEFNNLHAIARRFSAQADNLMHDSLQMRSNLEQLESTSLEQSRAVESVEEGLIRTTMISIESLTPRFKLMVDQIAHELGKKVSLSFKRIEGEIERSKLDKLLSPLEHMIRNAIDHGIEDAEIRQSLGKPSEGTIYLSLYRQGKEVILDFSDDGQGIEHQKVLDKAIELGLVDSDEALNKEDILNLVLRPGFSTQREVSVISGRGIGMDVVNTEIRRLGGSLTIHSTPKKGTQFIIILPLAATLSRVMMFKIHENYYALQLSSVQGITQLDKAQSNAATQTDAVSFQEHSYRLTSVNATAGNRPGAQVLSHENKIVLFTAASGHYGLPIDELIGIREVMVLPPPKALINLQMSTGAAITSDGSVAVVLDPLSFVGQQNALEDEHNHHSRQTHKQLTVLVVDDSVTIREVTKATLQRHHMQVETAIHGQDALSKLKRMKVDVILLDIEMPVMNGFEFLAVRKDDEALKKIPVIIVSSRTGDKHRNMALSLGVNSVLGKPYDENVLLEEISKNLPIEVQDSDG